MDSDRITKIMITSDQFHKVCNIPRQPPENENGNFSNASYDLESDFQIRRKDTGNAINLKK